MNKEPFFICHFRFSINVVLGISIFAFGQQINAAEHQAAASSSYQGKSNTLINWKNADGLTGALGIDPNESNFMETHHLKVGGWVEASASGNTNASPDNFNGPVTFNDRTGAVQMNQFYLWFEKTVTVNSDHFDIGGRFDFLYGTDAIFTQAYGVPAFNPQTGRVEGRGNWDLHLLNNSRFYNIALPQAYLEFNIPLGRGISIKAGHFYTPLGYEQVTAPNNFFVTRAYTFQYNPFTQTGILANYTVNSNWSVMAGSTTGSRTGGWNGNFNSDLGNWVFLGGASWTSDDQGTSLSLVSTVGKRSSSPNSGLYAIYTLVGKVELTDNLHYVIEHDHGFADKVLTARHPNPNGKLGNAQWYGINQYLYYDIKENLAAGIRAEWFRDASGFRIDGPARCAGSIRGNGLPYACGSSYLTDYSSRPANYFEVTAGLTYRPIPWILLRPNIRYDWSDNPQAFDAGKRNNQLMFTGDIVVTF